MENNINDSKNIKKSIQHDENMTVTAWRIIKHTKNTKTPNYAEHDENVTSQLNDHPFVQHLVTLKGNSQAPDGTFR